MRVLGLLGVLVVSQQLPLRSRSGGLLRLGRFQAPTLRQRLPHLQIPEGVFFLAVIRFLCQVFLKDRKKMSFDLFLKKY